jgi:hypothetical protein
MMLKKLFASSFVLAFGLVAQTALAGTRQYTCGHTGAVTIDDLCPHGKRSWLISAVPSQSKH